MKMESIGSITKQAKKTPTHLLIKTSLPSLPPLTFMFPALCFCLSLLSLPRSALGSRAVLIGRRLSLSPQRPAQIRPSVSAEARQQLRRQRLVGAPAQPHAQRHHPGVQGKRLAHLSRRRRLLSTLQKMTTSSPSRGTEGKDADERKCGGVERCDAVFT